MWDMVEKIPALDLEGLAINGLIEHFELRECRELGNDYVKIVAQLKNGSRVETECGPRYRIGRVYLTLVKYKEWGPTVVLEGVSEEMMSGITYDLDLGEE